MQKTEADLSRQCKGKPLETLADLLLVLAPRLTEIVSKSLWEKNGNNLQQACEAVIWRKVCIYGTITLEIVIYGQAFSVSVSEMSNEQEPYNNYSGTRLK